MFTCTARHPRLVLGAAIASVAGVVWLGRTAPAGVGRDLLHGCLILLSGAAAVLSLVAIPRRRPAAFVVDQRRLSFRTPTHESQVYLAVAFMLFIANGTLNQVPGAGSADAPLYADIVSRLLTATTLVLFGMVVVMTGPDPL
jgi:hypothetical protein